MFAQLNTCALLMTGFVVAVFLACCLMNTETRLRREQPFTRIQKGGRTPDVQEGEGEEKQAV